MLLQIVLLIKLMLLSGKIKKIDLKSGLSYGQIKDPSQNVVDIDNYYIKNTEINNINKEKNDVDANCAFNKTDVSNWKNQKN